MNATLTDKMRDIVENCLGDEVPYCQAACPMHTDIKGYVTLIGEGRYREAVELIREQLFLPATLGRICAHPCEGACKRNDINSAMSIAALKRFAADNYDDPADWDTTRAAPRTESVAVIGAGPAGAQAAYDLARAGFSVTVYDRLEVFGGMLRVGIPAYRLPRYVIDLEYSILEKLGVTFRMGVDIGTDITFEELRETHDGVVIAIGAHKGVVIPVPGHDLPGVFNAVDFLRDVSLHETYAGLGSITTVIGGGNVAIDAARSARRLGAEVNLVMLEGDIDAAPAHNWEIEEAIEEGVNIHFGRGTVEIAGTGEVHGIVLRRCTQVFNAEGAFDPQYNDNDILELPTDSVIFAVGQATQPELAPVFDSGRGGRFIVDELTLQTSDQAVVVAGDASGHSVIAVEAMAEGRKAATTLMRLFDGADLRADRERERAYESKLENDLPEDAPRRPRAETRKKSAEERINTFMEYDMGLTEEQAREEASGCLKCECLKCVKECQMLSEFTECPKHLFQEILDAQGDVDPVVPYSCNMCKQCTLACPKDFDMQGIFGGMRTEMVKANDGKSPMKGHNVIYMHQKLGFSRAFNTTVAAPEGVTKRVFIPGCSLPSHNPEAVGKIFSHLQDKLGNTGAILKCCGKPTKAVGQTDLFKERYAELQAEIDKLGAEEIIVACQSCYLNMSAYSPNQKVRSLWEIMPEIGMPEGTVGKGAESDITFAIHDSCSTRDRARIHDGVRWMLDELGYKTEEPPHTRENARCCGFGGMVVPANPELATRVMSRRTAEVESDSMVTYCAACRESMVKGGKQAAHLLDLVFEPVKTNSEDFVGTPTSPIGPWANRYKAKKALINAAKQHKRDHRAARKAAPAG